jgi:hypothetical protein
MAHEQDDQQTTDHSKLVTTKTVYVSPDGTTDEVLRRQKLEFCYLARVGA